MRGLDLLEAAEDSAYPYGMRVALILVLMMVAAPSGAWDGVGPEPPERYVHPYSKGMLRLQEVPSGRVYRLCRQLYAKHRKWAWLARTPRFLLGCAVPLEKECYVIFRRGDWHTMVHEVAHCNGWSDKHEP